HTRAVYTIGAIMPHGDSRPASRQVLSRQGVSALRPRDRPVAGDLRFPVASQHEKRAGRLPRSCPNATAALALGPARGGAGRGRSPLFRGADARAPGAFAAALPAVLAGIPP